MNIKVFQNRKIEKDYFYNEGTQNENNSTVLTFEVPLGYEDFSKRIVFITEDGNFWDYINNNQYEIKNNITKYGKVEAYLWLTKDNQDFRSQNFELNFYENENADNLVPTEEQLDGFATVLDVLELKINEVEELKNTIYQLQENVDNALIELDKKQQNYEQRFQNIDNKLKLKLDEVKANPFVKNVQYDNKTATFTFTAYDNTQIIVDLPIEGTVKDGGYDPETQELYLVLVSGQEIRIPVTDLVNDYEGLETATIQILISADNKITANIKGGSITENLLSQEVAAKLNKVIDLTPYITKQESYEVFYTKQEVDEMVKEIQETNKYQSEIIDQFKNEFKQITVSGDSIHITDAAELPMELVPYGEPVQTVIEAEKGTTVEGESVVVADGDVNKEVKVTVNGNSYQETTEGYNLLNTKQYMFGGEIFTDKITKFGVTATINSDGSVTLNGTSTQRISLDFQNYTNNSHDFILSKGVYSSYINLIDVNGIDIIAQNKSNNIISEDVTIRRARYFIDNNKIFNNTIIYPQFTQSKELQPYEPYTNGVATPNTEYPQEYEVIDGVNRFNPKNTTNVFIQNDGSETPNDYAMCTDYIEVKGNVVSIGSNLNWFDVIAFYDKDKNIISRTIVSSGNTLDIIDFRTFKKEIPSNAKYIRYFCGNRATEAMLAFGDYDIFLPYGHIGLVQRGKNLFVPTYKVDNISITVINATLTFTDDEYTFVATGKDMYFGQVLNAGNKYTNNKGTLYNVKGKSKIYLLLTNSELVSNYITAYDSNKISLGFSSINSYRGSYNIPEGAEYISLRIGYSNATVGKTYKTKVMLSFEEITDYEKYIEPIVHPIDLAGNKLAKVGEIADLLKIGVDGSVKIGDKVIKEYVFTGDEIWGRYNVAGSTTAYRFYTSFMRGLIVGSLTASDTSNVLCNMLIAKSPNQTYLGQEGISIDTDGTIRIYSNKTKEMTTDEFKNWLKSLYEAGTPLRLLYETTEPTTIELPSIEPITLFEGTNVFELITNLGTTMEVTYNYVTPSPSIDRPSEILTVEGSYSTELQNEYATITNTLPLTLTNELLGEIVTLTEEEAKELNLDGAGKYVRTDWIRVNGKDLTWSMNNSPIQNKITNRFVAAFANNVGDANIVSAYCNILKRKTPNQIWNEDEMAIGQTKSEITIRVPIELTTNADVRAFFEKNNGYILLKQNPVYEKITDETELEQLSAYDKQVSFFGVNNINTFPTDDLVKAPLKIHATYSKSNKLTIQSLEDRLASLESQVTNLQDNQI